MKEELDFDKIIKQTLTEDQEKPMISNDFTAKVMLEVSAIQFSEHNKIGLINKIWIGLGVMTVLSMFFILGYFLHTQEYLAPVYALAQEGWVYVSEIFSLKVLLSILGFILAHMIISRIVVLLYVTRKTRLFEPRKAQ